jgi:hypothetical protein
MPLWICPYGYALIDMPLWIGSYKYALIPRVVTQWPPISVLRLLLVLASETPKFYHYINYI